MFKCYIGKKRILLEHNNDGIFFYICIIERNDTVQYVTFENVFSNTKSLINEIMKTEEDILIQQKFNCKKVECDYNVFKRFTRKKKQNKNDNNAKNGIENCILKILILYYGLNKDINNKRMKEIKESEKFYLINYEFIKQLKKCFNYSEISEVIQNNINSFNDSENNYELLLNEFEFLKCNNKELNDLKSIKMIPNEEIFIQGLKHFTNFIIVNSTI